MGREKVLVELPKSNVALLSKGFSRGRGNVFFGSQAPLEIESVAVWLMVKDGRCCRLDHRDPVLCSQLLKSESKNERIPRYPFSLIRV